MQRFVFAATVFASTNAHSWIDCLSTTSRDALYNHFHNEIIYGGAGAHGKCEGYPRNYPGRGNSDINTLYTYQMTRADVEAGRASPCQDQNKDYSGWRHQLKVKAGTTVYYTYMPNGHVSKDKRGRGTSANIYWSGVSGKHLQSTSELTDENLLGGFQDYDDKRCGESFDNQGKTSGRSGDGYACIGQFTIPKDTPSGEYEFVWFWKFYKEGDAGENLRAQGFFNSAYSTCMDIQVEGIPQEKRSVKEEEEEDHDLCE